MVHNEEKNEKQLADSLKTSIYAVYDTVLKQFEPPFACQDSHIDDFMKLSVNDVQSRYFGHESDYILNKIAVFSQSTGEVKQLTVVERIKFLDFYIDNSKRKLQTIIQTLNFLPSGYFKMPQEQKQSIQDSIDNCIKGYVENYVIPDIDVQSEKFKDLNKQIECLQADRKLYEECYRDCQEYIKRKNLWEDYNYEQSLDNDN